MNHIAPLLKVSNLPHRLVPLPGILVKRFLLKALRWCRQDYACCDTLEFIEQVAASFMLEMFNDFDAGGDVESSGSKR